MGRDALLCPLQALFQSSGSQIKVSQVLSQLVDGQMTDDAVDDTLSAERGMQPLYDEQVKLGWIAGVYLPTIQNIFGVILYLRMAWIVGIAGVGQSLAIVCICCGTTLLTAFSMSAIATNGVVPAGGAYFMISRALGPEFGGAVGILFYLATTSAGAMYVLGAVELLLSVAVPDDPHLTGHMRIYGTLLLSSMAGMVYVGVKSVNRAATVFLVAVLFSITCIFIGFWTSPIKHQPLVCLWNGTVHEQLSNASLCKNPLMQPAYPGLKSSVFAENWHPHYSLEGESAPGRTALPGEVPQDQSTSFTMLLAIFFPSVTGIMAGSNRSGDLKNASKSIPKGTIAAITTTSLVYIFCVFFLGATVEGSVLRDKRGLSIGGRLVIAEAAWPSGWIVFIGAMLSCVGAGLQSLIGAPRLLRAIAQDDLIPILKPFAKASAAGEPVRALLLTVLIAECGVLIASLDLVAPIITMFFLMCYAFVNLACALQSLLKSPSWRPTFRYYHWTMSALAVVLCLLLMLISSWYYALAAMVMASMIYYYIQYNGAEKEWGDGLRGLSLQAAKFSLLRLEEGEQVHTKNWRPQVLVLAKITDHSFKPIDRELISLAGQLKGGKGLTIVGSVLHGTYSERASDAKRAQLALKGYMAGVKVDGFAQVLMAPTTETGVDFFIQGSGLGVLKHNTVVVGWPNSWRDDVRGGGGALFVRVLRSCAAAELAVMVPRNAGTFPCAIDPAAGTVDVWWIVHDGGMLLLISFLLQKDKAWEKCRLRIFVIAEGDDNSIQMERDMTAFLALLRIQADVRVVEMEADVGDGESDRARRMKTSSKLNSILRRHSSEAALVMLSLPAEPHDDDLPTSPRKFSAPEKTASASVKLIRLDDGVATTTTTNAAVDGTVDGGVSADAANNGSIEVGADNDHGPHAGSDGSWAVPLAASESSESYLELLELLIQGLPRIVMIRGGGSEVVTIFN